jgi:hypothetical protein
LAKAIGKSSLIVIDTSSSPALRQTCLHGIADLATLTPAIIVQRLVCLAVRGERGADLGVRGARMVLWYLKQQKVDILFPELLTQNFNQHVATNMMGNHNA